mmetsp:Transcript_34820/g.74161  ORF Transcript_34820/g.74161 Transcript_34820/m.74161 type:complete len:616 (+) Transcript_34820:337-2184(+)
MLSSATHILHPALVHDDLPRAKDVALLRPLAARPAIAEPPGVRVPSLGQDEDVARATGYLVDHRLVLLDDAVHVHAVLLGVGDSGPRPELVHEGHADREGLAVSRIGLFERDPELSVVAAAALPQPLARLVDEAGEVTPRADLGGIASLERLDLGQYLPVLNVAVAELAVIVQPAGVHVQPSLLPRDDQKVKIPAGHGHDRPLQSRLLPQGRLRLQKFPQHHVVGSLLGQLWHRPCELAARADPPGDDRVVLQQRGVEASPGRDRLGPPRDLRQVHGPILIPPGGSVPLGIVVLLQVGQVLVPRGGPRVVLWRHVPELASLVVLQRPPRVHVPLMAQRQTLRLPRRHLHDARVLPSLEGNDLSTTVQHVFCRAVGPVQRRVEPLHLGWEGALVHLFGRLPPQTPLVVAPPRVHPPVLVERHRVKPPRRDHVDAHASQAGHDLRLPRLRDRVPAPQLAAVPVPEDDDVAVLTEEPTLKFGDLVMVVLDQAVVEGVVGDGPTQCALRLDVELVVQPGEREDIALLAGGAAPNHPGGAYLPSDGGGGGGRRRRRVSGDDGGGADAVAIAAAASSGRGNAAASSVGSNALGEGLLIRIGRSDVAVAFLLRGRHGKRLSA